ncbi:hypothetical protein COU80_04115 [Candidatus Peregrinibacteria bacterium CG10_big_fil_rev_8_21_14_0_10_55_24]|nr:MAG: hypothetical protein COU80_04115 [Candidatus Peregrinibacteria bacterium CG10_big_fil_rev_8_21_14_0_10_55_24]
MLHFAVAGVPHSTPAPGGTVEGLKRAHALGITAMELEWVQRVPNAPKRMEEIRKTAEELKMVLTVHAPYYVNLNAQDPLKLAASIKRVQAALSMAELAGARSVCVHPAFYLGMDPREAYANVERATEMILKDRDKRFPSVNLAYETMGKGTQFGTLEEVLCLSKKFGLYPCVDTAHMHARSNGAYNSKKEFKTILDLYAKYLGKRSLNKVHFHYSGIEYTAKGERRHLPLNESDARWRDFLAVLKEEDIGGVVVCESPILEEDTLLLQKTYARI